MVYMLSTNTNTTYILPFIDKVPVEQKGDLAQYINHTTTTVLSHIINESFTPMLPNVTDISETSSGEGKHPALGVLLAMFSFITVLGNLLVITAVVKELYLRTVTNYLIVSLAIADVMVGGIVMPFGISYELTNYVWYYGTEWCDLWHSFDVLGSTASILNLCIISLDRYWAITDPIAYPTRMSPCRVAILIAFVWVCSAGISFPAIAWWKAVTPPGLPNNQCVFTEDTAYLIFSSLVSFYFPTIVMIFVYIQIYRAARNQRKSIKTGTKVLTSNRLFGPSGVMTLRIHRGGMAKLRTQTPTPEAQPFQAKSESDEDDPCVQSANQTPIHCIQQDSTNENGVHNYGLEHNNHTHHNSHNNHNNHNNHDDHQSQRPMKFITKRLRHLALSKRLSKLAKEQKAAKTLGIVVGVFIMCWLPFFACNVLLGLCGTVCVSNPELVMPIFTWLGYINSGVNPIIYALSMRDFRRAFGRIIFYCCPKYRFKKNKRRRHQTYRGNVTTSSFIA